MITNRKIRNVITYFLPIIIFPFIAYFMYSCGGDNEPPPVDTTISLFAAPGSSGCTANYNEDQVILIDIYKKNNSGGFDKYGSTVLFLGL